MKGVIMLKWSLVLNFMFLTVTSCEDNLTRSGYPNPRDGTAAAASSISDQVFVNLVFRNSPGGTVSVTDGLNPNPIPFEVVQEKGRVVITLKLQRGQIVNPRITVKSEGNSWAFTALFTANQSVSTYAGLEPNEHPVVLFDHKEEYNLKIDQETDFQPSQLTSQWIDREIRPVVRVKFQPEEPGAYCVRTKATAYIKEEDQLRQGNTFETSMGPKGLIISPENTDQPATVSVTR